MFLLLNRLRRFFTMSSSRMQTASWAKSASSVEPQDLEKARYKAIEMLSGDEDIRERLVTVGAEIGIIPRDAFITDLPEFSNLSGRLDRSG